MVTHDLLRVVFVCRRGAGRSVMAAALWEQAGGESRARGLDPADAVYADVIEVMGEVGIDVGGVAPRSLSSADVDWADLVVAIGCQDEIGLADGVPLLAWTIADPDGEGVAAMQALRDGIAEHVSRLARGDPC